MSRRNMFCRTLLLSLLSIPLVVAAPAPAQQIPQAGAPSKSAKQWAIEATAIQLHDFDPTGPYIRYRAHSIDAKGDQVRDTIQSKDGTVARLIFRNGKPLSAEEDTAERQRLQTMIDSPEAFAKHIKNDESSKKTGNELIRLLPEAMLYTYAEGQPQRPHDTHPGDPAEIVLDFKPNPAWSPPTMISNALTGLKGRVWIDPRSQHLTRLEASIFKGINVGLGLLAHIYPGGSFTVEEVHADDRRWMYAHFEQHITARAMMVKTIRENSDIQASHFAHVDSMSYREAIRVLLATPLPEN